MRPIYDEGAHPDFLGEGRLVVGLVVGVFLFLLLVIVFFNTFYIVSAGERGVLLTLGKPSVQVISEGPHLKFPFVQGIIIMNVRTQKYEADASAASKDLQIVTGKIATNYHLQPEQVVIIYTKLGIGYSDSVIQPMEQEVVKATTAEFTAEELITKREEVRIRIKEVMTQRLLERGIIVEEISITNFDFSSEFNKAIESKVTALQLMLKAQNDLERIKVEAEQAKATAIGRQQAMIAEAQGQSESIRLINEQLRKSPQYVDYLKVQRWNGVLPLATGGAIPFVNLTP